MNILIKVISLVVGIHLLIFASAVNSHAWSKKLKEEHDRNVQEAHNARWEIREKRKASLVPGLARSQILKVWGDPEQREFTEDKLIYWYDDEFEPMLLTFKRNKLVGWKIDKQTLSEREAEERGKKENYEMKRLIKTQKQDNWSY